MGILMGALGGAGAAMEDYFGNRQKADLSRENSLAEGQQRGDLQLRNELQTGRQRSDLDQKRQQAMALFQNQLADKNRTDLASRLDISGEAANGILSKNASKFYGDGGEYSVDGMTDEEKKQFAPSQRQVIEAKAKKAIETGDYKTAEELTKMMDAGKLTLGYGSKVIDQNDIDPETGEPRVLGDNSVDRADNDRTRSEARQTAADAAKTRAANPSLRASGNGAFDKELTSIKESQKVQTSQLRIAQQALSNATRAERPALQARVDSINAQLSRLETQAAERRSQIAKQPAGDAGSSGGKSSDASSKKDFSSLWN